MQLLITGQATDFDTALIQALTAAHHVDWCNLHNADQRAQALTLAATADAIIQVAATTSQTIPDLDQLDFATRGTYDLLLAAGPQTRFILLSSLRIFEQYPVTWWVTEHWAPRPTPAIADLVPYLAELVVREVSRVLPLHATVLRLGEVVREQRPTGATDPRWLHFDDALMAVTRALSLPLPPPAGPQGWQAYHIPGGGTYTRFPLALAAQPPLAYQPTHDLTGGAEQLARLPTATPPAPLTAASTQRHNVAIFGAGGPLGVVTMAALAPDHRLHLSDRYSFAMIAAAPPQSPGAPLPVSPGPPHSEQLVDVTDPAQVLAAAQGQEVLINSTVVRDHPVQSFRVNTLGAYNVMRAAVQCGIRRVVQTGPRQLIGSPAGYRDNFHLVDDAPIRPGINRYFVSKFLGQEICRIFAECYQLEVPTLLFSRFINTAQPLVGPTGDYQMLISWADAGQAMRQAVVVDQLPNPFEIMQITADLPNGRFTNEKAKRLLNWAPQDRLEERWQRRLPGSTK